MSGKHHFNLYFDESDWSTYQVISDQIKQPVSNLLRIFARHCSRVEVLEMLFPYCSGSIHLNGDQQRSA